MTKKELEVWLRDREPGIPGPFLPHLLESGDGGPGAGGLLELGAEALERALERPAWNHEAAYRLLAADAYLTYACEAVVQDGDVRRSLEEIFGWLGDRFS